MRKVHHALSFRWMLQYRFIKAVDEWMTGHSAVEILLTGPWTGEPAHSLPTGFPQLRKRPVIHWSTASKTTMFLSFLPSLRDAVFNQKQKLHLIESWDSGGGKAACLADGNLLLWLLFGQISFAMTLLAVIAPIIRPRRSHSYGNPPEQNERVMKWNQLQKLRLMECCDSR